MATAGLDRITFDPMVMGGKPCVCGLRGTVGMLATGRGVTEILKACPCLEKEDLRQALSDAAWRAEEIEVPQQRYDDAL